ncbi:hypothetical protein [Fodinibius sp.]|uniref:hypothetical protein n=1 Tax=Fodinibius sp. TaxID=1872440 RepID=UPI002ACE1E59|nr:hypothetical protein [Fodinibius sp.]MDZ7659129.1 hypothetical protein [Fodinibius sp.]
MSINSPFVSGQQKTVSKARSIALTNTVVSIGSGVAAVALFDNNTIQKTGAYLTLYGIVAGASTGNFYAEDYPRGVIGMGARAVGTILMLDGTREVFGQRFSNTLGVDNEEVSLTDTKMLIGEGLILAGFIYNMISLNASVKEHNSGGRNFSINITPAVVDDEVAPVLTASLRF